MYKDIKEHILDISVLPYYSQIKHINNLLNLTYKKNNNTITYFTHKYLMEIINKNIIIAINIDNNLIL